MNIAYRISTAVLAFGSILCAFFLKFFSFTLSMVIITRTYEYSIFEAIKKLASTTGSGTESSIGIAEVQKAVGPMFDPAITFFVLVAVACLIALAITIISAATEKYIPQAILSGAGFIVLVIAAGCGSKALGCLLGDEPQVTLASIVTGLTGEVTKDNALSALGSAVSKIQIASLSYGFYIVMAIFAVIFIWTLVYAFTVNNDQPKRVAGKKKKAYKRKKPMKKLSAIGR
ncbi:MAG: hypothetical protein E7558_00765 [Ruminococcaceae bacterium]|nr:hypothetical protein [Oscillospiraceae bacterium]